MPPGPAPRNQWLGRWYLFAIQMWGGQVLVFDNWWPSFKPTANTTIREPLRTVLSRRFGQYQWDLARISGFRNKAVCGLLEEQILSWLLLYVPATSGLVDCRPCNRLHVGLRGFFGHRWELAVPLNLAGRCDGFCWPHAQFSIRPVAIWQQNASNRRLLQVARQMKPRTSAGSSEKAQRSLWKNPFSLQTLRIQRGWFTSRFW